MLIEQIEWAMELISEELYILSIKRFSPLKASRCFNGTHLLDIDDRTAKQTRDQSEAGRDERRNIPVQSEGFGIMGYVHRLEF
jgi:hypothetical protein